MKKLKGTKPKAVQAPAIVSPPEGRRVAFADLSEKQKAVFTTPSGFGRHFLKIPLTPKQAEVCDAFMPNRAHVSAVFCNEAGKTTKIIPTVTLWHLTVFPRRGENGGVTATSGSWAQITNQMMPALKSYERLFPRWEFLNTEIKRDGFPNFMAYSCSNPGRAEGFHGQPETPLLMWFDECKSVPDAIIEAGEDRCRPQRMGLLSSPGYSVGKFYRTHTTEGAYWKRFKMTVDDCPWIDRHEMQRIITRRGGGNAELGLQDPFVRSAYFAEFMAFVEDSLISLSDIERCLEDPPQFRPGGRHAFCDFAAGGDENVLAVRHGNRVWIEKAWRDKNTMSAVGEFVRLFTKLRNEIGLRAEEIEGDADGLGGPMVQRLHELDWPILPFHSNGTPKDPTRFENRASENWWNGCESVKRRQILFYDDADLHGQMVDRKQEKRSSQLIKVERKDFLFRRQAKEGRPQISPDRAEAVFGAMADLPVLGTVQMMENKQARGPWEDDPDYGPGMVEREGSIPEEVLRGFQC